MRARLILGCHGRKFYGFTMCQGVSNSVADLRKLGGSSKEILDYLDHHCKLFDEPTSDINKINNVVKYLNRNKVINDHVEKVIQEFLALHKPCGFYMFIEPIEV